MFTIKEPCFPLYTNIGIKYTSRGSKDIIRNQIFFNVYRDLRIGLSAL